MLLATLRLGAGGAGFKTEKERRRREGEGNSKEKETTTARQGNNNGRTTSAATTTAETAYRPLATIPFDIRIWFAVRFQGLLKEQDNLRLARTSRGFAQLEARFGGNLNFESDNILGSDESDSHSDASTLDSNERAIYAEIYGDLRAAQGAPSQGENGGGR